MAAAPIIMPGEDVVMKFPSAGYKTEIEEYREDVQNIR
jgi:hypothetical protein